MISRKNLLETEISYDNDDLMAKINSALIKMTFDNTIHTEEIEFPDNDRIRLLVSELLKINGYEFEFKSGDLIIYLVKGLVK